MNNKNNEHVVFQLKISFRPKKNTGGSGYKLRQVGVYKVSLLLNFRILVFIRSSGRSV